MRFLFIVIAGCGLLTAGEFRDDFRDLSAVENLREIELRPEPVEVPTTPQLRLSPEDLNHGLPESVSRKHREEMARLRPEIEGRIQVGDNLTPQDLITSWTVRAPYLRKPYFPGLLRLHNGDLLTFYSEGQGHGNFAQGRGVMIRSRDGGLNWTPPVGVPNEAESAKLSFGNAQCQTRDGTIWVTAFRRGERSLLRSFDNGATWRIAPLTSERIRFLDPVGELSNSEFLWLGFSMGPVQESDALSGGKATIPTTAVLRRVEGDDPNRWDWEVREHPAIPTGFFDEASVVETRTPGHTVVLMRADSEGSYLFQSESNDYGRSWRRFRTSGIWSSWDASRPHLIAMQDGTLVCAVDERSLSRTGVHVSFDDGRTWSPGDRMLALDSPEYLQGDFAYPKIAELPGGRVLFVLYNAFNLDPAKIGLFGRILNISVLRNRHAGAVLALRNPMRNAATLGQWSFDEPLGDVLYERGDRQHGFLAGASRTEGRFEGGLRFDGAGYAAIPDHPTLQVGRSFTLEAWIQTSDPRSPQTILAKRPRYYFGLEDGKLTFAFEGKPHASATTTIAEGQWHHAAVVIKPQPDRTWRDRICFFLDGKLDGCGRVEFEMTRTTADYLRFLARIDARTYDGPRYRPVTTPQTGPAPSDRLYIGIDSNARSRRFRGLIDEVAIHNGALEDRLIASHAAARHADSGELVSRVIRRPVHARWGRFEARCATPLDTSVHFSVLDENGNPLVERLEPGGSLSAVPVDSIRLRARLSSSHPGRTPLLQEWRVNWE